MNLRSYQEDVHNSVLSVCKLMQQYGGMSCFFLGSTPKTLELIKTRMAVDFPNIREAGAFSPPFKDRCDDNENDRMIEAINKCHPDVIWVGMTAPKKEKWISTNREKLDVKCVGAVGAVFDFYSGTFKRPSSWFQEHGLEWLPRFIRQPKELWKRNVISTPMFLARVIWARSRSRKMAEYYLAHGKTESSD